jgi:hypothetical protein
MSYNLLLGRLAGHTQLVSCAPIHAAETLRARDVNRSFIGDGDSGDIPSRRDNGRFEPPPSEAEAIQLEAERGCLEPKFQTRRWKNGRDAATSGKVACHGAFERRQIQKSPVNHHGRLQTTAIGSRG